MSYKTSTCHIPLVDLKQQYSKIKDEIDEAIHLVLNNTSFILGEEHRLFELEFANFCALNLDGTFTNTFCAACGNGTDALEIALKALEVGPGDEVITASHTFFATIEAIINRGAKPIFVDIDPSCYLIDASKIEEQITSRTKAIIAVHLYGQPCDMDTINAVAKKYNLKVIEDAAQAHGAYYKNRRTGTLGDIATFSFFPGKNLGCYGDGGAVVSTNKDLVDKARSFSNHGRKTKYEHNQVGINSRLDNLQAAILRVKLRHLDGWLQRRRLIAACYSECLSNAQVVTPSLQADVLPAWHLYVIKSSNRDQMQQYLKKCDISSGIHYPIPAHLQPAVKFDYPNENLPITESICKDVLSLPIYPELSLDQVRYISSCINEFKS